ncbi:MAG: hypothetical protein EP329_05245, partial [Deltaproteobacteria bacterium]
MVRCMVRTVRLLPLAMALAGLSCTVDAPLVSPPEAEPTEVATVSLALSSINCSESTDTGYSQGNAFPITVVTVDGKKVEKNTANAYYVMAQAAANQGVTLKVVSGFRTMAEQQYLYNCYINCNCNNCNLAAYPGYSNHQSGHALDLNTSSAGVLTWLNAHAAAYGFERTVPSENWHWEWWGGGPGGGPCSPDYPEMTIEVKTYPPTGQTANFATEGSSSGTMDLWVGQEFVTEVIIRNAPSGAATSTTDSAIAWVWFESPYLEPVSYHIYTDYPNFDAQTWKLSVADGYTQNPDKANPPANGKYYIEQFAPGEGKKIAFVTRAVGYSIGKVDHPDVRAWIQHVAGYYGEQTSWNDAVETNHAGGLLRAYKQHDVFARDRWDFDGPDAADTEGWAVGHAVSSLAIVPADDQLAVQLAGSDPYIVNTRARIDAGAKKALELTLRSNGGPRLAQVFFKTAADNAWNEAKSEQLIVPGGGQMQVVHADFSGNPAWTGTVTALRFDPAVDGTDTFRVDRIRAVASGVTSGDADGDGYLAAPGPDCDDGAAATHPGADEVCNGRDDDCDGAVDEGVANACGACGAVPEETCNGVDDDCDGEIDEGCAVCTPTEEICNGADDDCDGETDEGCEVCDPDTDPGCAPCGPERCNGVDDDCDGEIDEDVALGTPCEASTGTCAAPGTWACGPKETFVCAAADPRLVNGEVCNGVDDDCDGQVDELLVCAVCAPGVTGTCALEWVPVGCVVGTHVCGDDGHWGACEPKPGCFDEPAGEDVDASTGEVVGGDALGGDATLGDADGVGGGRAEGCA